MLFGISFARGSSDFWTGAEAPSGEVDETSCFSWPRAAGSVRLVEGNGLSGRTFLPPVRNILREDSCVIVVFIVVVIVVGESVLCLLLLRDRLCEVERGRYMRKREG